MDIQYFFNSKIRVIVFIIAWVIIGLLLGYLKLDKLKEFAKMNDEKISKKNQFITFIKPVVIIFTINIIYWVINYSILNKKNI